MYVSGGVWSCVCFVNVGVIDSWRSDKFVGNGCAEKLRLFCECWNSGLLAE